MHRKVYCLILQKQKKLYERVNYAQPFYLFALPDIQYHVDKN